MDGSEMGWKGRDKEGDEGETERRERGMVGSVLFLSII
jgi:hypothetical protein